MRPLLVLLLLLTLGSSGCSRPKKEPLPPLGKHPADNGAERDNYSEVSTEDGAMNAAIAHAKATAGNFVRAFHEHRPGTSEFYVKKPYSTGTSMEHMWIKVCAEHDGIIQGEIVNDAEETKAVKLGDQVSVYTSELTDWRYTEGKKLVGGFTIRYFLNNMSSEERQDFLKHADFEL